MPRTISAFLLMTLCCLALVACGTTPAAGTTTPEANATMTTPQASYPQMGHAPDYSWVAGRVLFTAIQGGCIYVETDPAALDPSKSTQPTQGGGTGVIVSTAVAGDTSPPLRDITPQTGASPTEPPTSRFVPGGEGWDPSAYKDGDYVVLLGRLAGEGDVREICPGGTAYVVSTMLKNP